MMINFRLSQAEIPPWGPGVKWRMCPVYRKGRLKLFPLSLDGQGQCSILSIEYIYHKLCRNHRKKKGRPVSV